MFHERDSEVKVAERELKSLLVQLVDNSTHEHNDNTPERLFDAIEKFVDAKVEAAVNDLDDRINKRGVYDPDW